MPEFLTPLVQPMLEAAVEANDAVKARLALSLGADPNMAVSIPLLHRAASEGRVQVVEALLKAGAKTTAKDPDGDTALLTSLRGTLIMDPKKAASGSKNQMLEGKATAKAKAWTPMQQGSKKVADKTTTWVLDDGGNISDRGGQRGQRKLPPTTFATVVGTSQRRRKSQCIRSRRYDISSDSAHARGPMGQSRDCPAANQGRSECQCPRLRWRDGTHVCGQ